MIFLSIDPSSTELGWAVFDDDRLVAWGGISTAKVPYVRRFMHITDCLKKLRILYRYTEVACEAVIRFEGRWVPALEVAIMSIKRWAREENMRIDLYNPSTWRSSFANTARATKEDVARIARLVYPDIPQGVSDHVTDAIGIGHHHYGVRRIEIMSEGASK